MVEINFDITEMSINYINAPYTLILIAMAFPSVIALNRLMDKVMAIGFNNVMNVAGHHLIRHSFEPFETVKGRSIVDCMSYCLQADRCSSVNMECVAGICDCYLLPDAAMTVGDLTEVTNQGVETFYAGLHISMHLPPPTPNNPEHDFYKPVDVDVTVTERGFVRFSVKACGDLQMFLSSLPRCQGDCYHLVVGGWGNQYSHVRPGYVDESENHLMASTPHLLNCSEFVRLWVTWSPDFIKMGKGWIPNQEVLLERIYTNMYQLNYLSVSGFDQTSAFFILVDVGTDP